MAFKPLKRVDLMLVKSAVIGNSAVLAVGDAIVPGATGHATAVVGAYNTTGRILGVVTAITGLNGKVLELNSVTASASNETTKQYWVTYVLAATETEFQATLTAAAGTTTDSAGFGSFNVDTATNSNGKLLESGFTLWSGTAKQFMSLGVDANDNTNLTVIGHFNSGLTI